MHTIGRRLGELSSLRRAICTGRSRRAAGMVGFGFRSCVSSLILSSFAQISMRNLDVFWQSKEIFSVHGFRDLGSADFFPVDPKKVAGDLRRQRVTEPCRETRLTIFDADLRPSGAGLFWRGPKKSPFFSAPKKPKKS